MYTTDEGDHVLVAVYSTVTDLNGGIWIMKYELQ